MRNDPGGIGVESLASEDVLETRICAPPSSTMRLDDRSATVLSPRGIAAGGSGESGDAGRSGPNCTGISRRSAPSRVRYIRALSTDTLRCSLLSNLDWRFTSSIASRSLFSSVWTIRSVR
jgi:hypothetical protein